MEFLGPEGAAESVTGEDELPPQPDSEAPAITQEEIPGLRGDLMVDVGPEAGSEAEAGGRAPENGAASPEPDEPLDPSLVQLFLEAKNEAQESALASELPDIPVQELLSELVSLRRSLRGEPPSGTGAANGRGDPAEPQGSRSLEAVWPALYGSRRHVLHGLLLSLTLVMAVASVLIGADRVVSRGQNQSPEPPAVATAHPGVVVKQTPSNQLGLEPTPEATPVPTSTRQPAYFIYTVERGDTLTSIAATFGLSLDHILWTNPDVIDDPNLLLVGDRLLIPNVAGMIYYVKPGDVLSAIGRLLPDRGPDDPGLPPGHSQPP